jgi:FMN phosphatase YigB (HAD superfamily)
MTYATVLFDLDHTLFDTDTSETAALHDTLRLAGIDDPGLHLDAYIEINAALWAAVERGEIGAEGVRLTRFEQLVARTGLEADPGELAEAFVDGLAAHGGAVSGREVRAGGVDGHDPVGPGDQRPERGPAHPHRAARHRPVFRRRRHLG